MLACNRWETKQIIEGKASGISRKYNNGVCPHEVRGELILTSEYLPGVEKQEPFGKAEIISVRPGTFGQFSRDERMIRGDGYLNSIDWKIQIGKMYPGLKDTDSMHHITFKLIHIEEKFK